MTPVFLVPEQEVTKNGEGAAVDVGTGGLLERTLGILAVIEQESLDVAIHGSADGTTWTPKPISAFPQKFYAGVTKIVFDPAKYPGTAFIRAQWKVNRWGNWKSPAMFRFFVFAASAE